MILNIPLPQILKIMIVTRAMRARSQLVEALLMAEPAKAQSDADDDRTGYDRRKKTHDLLDTDKLIISARIGYKRPATTIPPQA